MTKRIKRNFTPEFRLEAAERDALRRGSPFRLKNSLKLL